MAFDKEVTEQYQVPPRTGNKSPKKTTPRIPVLVVSRRTVIEMFDSVPGLLEKYKVISLLDTGLASPFIYSIYRRSNRFSDEETGIHKNLLTLHVEDIDDRNKEDHLDSFGGPLYQYAFFTEAQADRIIDFILDRKSSKSPYLIHCLMGYSRSGAVGLFLTRILGLSEEDYFRNNPAVYKSPNSLILGLLEKRWKERSLTI